MAALRVVKLSGVGTSTALKLRVVKLSGTGTAFSQKLRVVKLSGVGGGGVVVSPILDWPDIEPGRVVTQTAVLGQTATSTVTWTWVQVSGPTVTLTPNGPAVTFTAPSVVPGVDGTIVLGVTATVGGTDSAQVTATFLILAQTRWAWNGSTWIGATPTTL